MDMAVHSISYWCDDIKPVGKYLSDDISKQISRGGRLWLCVINENGAYYYLTRERFVIGLKKYLENPAAGDFLEMIDHMLCIDTEYVDDSEADAIIQYAPFDKIVFHKEDSHC